MKTLILAAGTILALAQVASAQTTNPPSQQTSPNQHMQNMQQQVQTNLQQAGFTDVKVAPESFLVHAKDKSGNPVMMIINPDSVAEVTTVTNRSMSKQNGSMPQQNGSAPSNSSTSTPMQSGTH